MIHRDSTCCVCSTRWPQRRLRTKVQHISIESFLELCNFCVSECLSLFIVDQPSTFLMMFLLIHQLKSDATELNLFISTTAIDFQWIEQRALSISLNSTHERMIRRERFLVINLLHALRSTSEKTAFNLFYGFWCRFRIMNICRVQRTD